MEADFKKNKNSQALNPNTLEGLVKICFDVQLHIGHRGGNHQLKPESFIIHQDENGQKNAMLLFSKCTKTHKDAGKRNKESL